MYKLLGLNRNLETIMILSSLDGVIPQNTIQLKNQYRNYLKAIQPEFTTSKAQSKVSFEVETIFDIRKSQDLISLFSEKSNLNDLKQETVIDPNIAVLADCVEQKTQQALNQFKKMDPVLYGLFNLVIEKIFFADSNVAGGGSSSGALGCIWLNPRPNWTLQDYIEFFVHELTHNLLFLDERRIIHYPNYKALEKSENYAHSAILRRSRPLDKVIHSLFVVYEVLAFRLKHFNPNQKTFLHPDTQTLYQGALDTIVSLKKIKKSLLSEHLWEVLNKLESETHQLMEIYHELETASY